MIALFFDSYPTSQPLSQPATQTTQSIATSQPTLTPPKDTLFLEAQIFAGFQASDISGIASNEFVLPRAEFEANYQKTHISASLRIESLRSAGAESFFGIDGDSLIFRIKRAYLGAEYGVLSARFGVIPDVWIETLEERYPLRPISPSLGERSGFFFPSDLGASASLLHQKMKIKLSVTNGEGANQEEQNVGKNTTAVFSLHPLSSLGIHASYRAGSLGVGSAANHRASGAVTFFTPKLLASVEASFAIGLDGDGARRSLGIGALASTTPVWSWLGVFARFDHLNTELSLAQSAQDAISAGLFFDSSAMHNDGARLFIAFQQEKNQENAGPIAAASSVNDLTRISIILSISTGKEVLQ